MTKQVQYQPRSQINSTTFNNTYQLVATFTAPVIAYKVVNTSNVLVDISEDGTNDHDVAPAESAYVWDIRTNHGREQQLAFPVGTSIYVKGAVAGVGSVYVVALNERQ